MAGKIAAFSPRFPGKSRERHHVARQRAARERAAGPDVRLLADARLRAQSALDLPGIRAQRLAQAASSLANVTESASHALMPCLVISADSGLIQRIS